MNLRLSINNFTKEKIDTGAIHRILIRAKSKIKMKNKNLELSLVFVSDRVIRKLNSDYLHKNQVTDVLAFPDTEEFVKLPSKTRFLGEIIISVPQAKRQADELNHSLGEEIEILTVHGLLHLLGYNDKKIKERRLMDKMTRVILERS